MKVKVETPKQSIPKLPYLAYDTRGNLCLVGSYAAIMLEGGGNGYSGDTCPQEFTPKNWKVANLVTVTLTQD